MYVRDPVQYSVCGYCDFPGVHRPHAWIVDTRLSQLSVSHVDVRRVEHPMIERAGQRSGLSGHLDLSVLVQAKVW